MRRDLRGHSHTIGLKRANQRDDYEMRALVDEVFDQVIRGQIGPKEASDKLDAAGVPFEVQCRVLCGATKEIAA